MRPKDFDIDILIKNLILLGSMEEALPKDMKESELTEKEKDKIARLTHFCPQCHTYYAPEDEADPDGDYPGYCKGCAGED